MLSSLRPAFHQATRLSTTKHRAFRLSARNMASSSGTKHEWIVILPDEVGALERRMKVRPDHLKNITSRVDDGFWLMGGGMLEDIPEEGETLKLKGSVMLAWAESKEQVMKEIEQDVYFKNDVWDKSKIQIYPFKSAFRKST